MAENEYENEYENKIKNQNNNSNVGFEDMTDWIFQHKFLVISILSLIPVLIFTIIGFKNNHYILGLISISFLITLFILLYALAYKTGKISHYFLLVFLLFLQFGLIIFFMTQIKKSVSNDMYLNFYNRQTFANKKGNPLSFYGMGDKETTLQLMKGSSYGFALKEDMPIDLGTEATYSFWLKICPDNFNKGNTIWKTVWYRGDSIGTDSMYQKKTPGVYLAPNTNKMIITVACDKGVDEANAIVLDDIPLNNWFCITIVLEGRSLDCYLNGLLEKSISLTGAPDMINSNVIKGKNGFNGLIAFFRYNSAALDSNNILDLFEREKATIERIDYDLETCFEVK
jgi:hypothetical protein